MSHIHYGGLSDVGYGRKINEDYIHIEQFSQDWVLAIICDGFGSFSAPIQPAAIAVASMLRFLKRCIEAKPDDVNANPQWYLKEALLHANEILGAYRQNELYEGFGACATLCLVKNTRIALAHCGHTRLYHLRGTLRQLTKDHTKAYKMMVDGIISEEQYYTHPGRLELTSGLGAAPTLEIDGFTGTLKKGDILLLSTDGIHYAIRPQFIQQLILAAGDCHSACSTLITAAKEEKYIDNMSAIAMFIQ